MQKRAILLILALTAPGAGAEEPTLPDVGDLLVSRRGMRDPNFSETVVLVTRFGEGGSSGLIVNRPLDVAPHERFPEIRGLERHDEPLFQGGPVATGSYTLLLRGRESPEGTRRVIDGVHLGSSRELLERMASSRAGRKGFRLYAGHAGWAPGQLEWEIERGVWHVVSGDAEIVFADDPAAVWEWLLPKSRENLVELRLTPRPSG